jgi:hypothetical protein
MTESRWSSDKLRFRRRVAIDKAVSESKKILVAKQHFNSMNFEL